MQEQHTIENPYCSDSTCWCHQQCNYHGAFTYDLLWVEPNEQTVMTAIEVLGDHSYDWLAVQV